MTLPSLQRLPFVVGTCNRYFNPGKGKWYVGLATGACYVTNVDDVLTTVLGSCIAACVRDPRRGIGGMNHFLLPSGEGHVEQFTTDVGRYGVHAMELLVNEVMKAGATRSELEIKIFGGGEVIDMHSDTGIRNVSFVKAYLKAEGYRIAALDVGGGFARRLEYSPISGVARVKRMEGKKALPSVVLQEEKYRKDLSQQPTEGDIELFS